MALQHEGRKVVIREDPSLTKTDSEKHDQIMVFNGPRFLN